MLTKHDERKMPKNLGHIESLARSYTDTAIKTLAGIMMEQTSPPMARIVAAKVLLDRGWGKPKEMHHSEVDDNKALLKVVNEIVHVYETREQIEFRDQTPLLELTPEDPDGNGSKSPHERRRRPHHPPRPHLPAAIGAGALQGLCTKAGDVPPPMPRIVRPGGRQHRLELATQRQTAKLTLSQL